MILVVMVFAVFLDRTPRAKTLLKCDVVGIKCTRKVGKCMPRYHRRTHLCTIGLSPNLVCV
ncbi:hypothetical protein PF005_g16138 [Phytophthora fragariae]|uniref:Uncharacterized protein n=1 Tax=Phytophthora fragariae TaxID=53985 RepID=A0A6A3IW29_9STRA|nr:hypothetical protein PF003_g5518 [Phytophthora fragariae]KAE8910360.1 hypothetical protein PF003_g5516 [Phytophthora fragariae]KAE8910362.1 hypothetical protein PF003_g5514 [Phytophthora fragariae]KAE8910364.1 hypothetical protein PF003_g5512 [Phytophthora fragariae]KAE8910366.1 hypothetical protein PF003_g5510 [Phytophthora fragariae]